MVHVLKVGGDEGAEAGFYESFAGELKVLLSGEDISLKVTSWSPDSAADSYLDADFLLGCHIQEGSPPPKTSFVYYDAGSDSENTNRSLLEEWTQASRGYSRASKAVGERMDEGFKEGFGPDRTIGVRGAPMRILQGRQCPALMMNLGIVSASAELEISQAVRIIVGMLAGDEEN